MISEVALHRGLNKILVGGNKRTSVYYSKLSIVKCYLQLLTLFTDVL